MTGERSYPQSILPIVLATYFAVIGLICGVVYAVGGAIFDLAHGGLNAGSALALLALIGMPLLAALSGLVIGHVLARPVARILVRLSNRFEKFRP